eukprot:NODE_11960_length_529_cov_12.369458_g11672_i0.p1 GENE.NODE_11960_length_529_cov_12.369458_g11672_i0~~NODE_11960_length_529_cov_12.369458_g11672_i0.p1  ORF type:complete len:157 (+),score=26.45 NODE_11960_length_529_cov_12.369458_g11672_i0:60-473(+)
MTMFPAVGPTPPKEKVKSLQPGNTLDDEAAFALERDRLRASISVLKDKEDKFMQCFRSSVSPNQDCKAIHDEYINWLGIAFCPFQHVTFATCVQTNNGNPIMCRPQQKEYATCLRKYMELLPSQNKDMQRATRGPDQ